MIPVVLPVLEGGTYSEPRPGTVYINPKRIVRFCAVHGKPEHTYVFLSDQSLLHVTRPPAEVEQVLLWNLRHQAVEQTEALHKAGAW